MLYIDSHIHFYEDGKNVSIERLDKIIDFYISNRFKKIIDMGHKQALGLKLKKIFEGKITIKTCGYALYKDGGYGSFIGRPVRSKKEFPEIINTLSKMGVDFIKVINSGIVTTNPEIPISKGGFTFDELKMIVEESKSYGLEVKCHVNGDKKIQESIIAGVSSIEHGFFISSETIEMMKEYNVEWTPTANALLSITKFLQGIEKKYIEDIVNYHLEKIRIAKKMGIKINIGSDGGSKGINHIEGFLKELKLIVD